DQDLLMLGAGNLEPEPAPIPAVIRINYASLYPYIRDIKLTLDHHHAVQFNPRSNPFRYPDLIRLCIKQDGFIPYEWEQITNGGKFSELFIDRMRGKGKVAPPAMPADKNPLCVVRAEGD